MQFSVFAIAVLAAATSSSCMIAATATAAAARKTKVTKKGGSISGSYGAIGPSTPDGNPPGGYCATSDDCAIPADLTHGFCAWCGICQSGQPGAICDTGSVLIHAKADNRVHRAIKRQIVLSKMIWIHRMPSVVEHGCTESVNGEYSGHIFFIIHTIC